MKRDDADLDKISSKSVVWSPLLGRFFVKEQPKRSLAHLCTCYYYYIYILILKYMHKDLKQVRKLISCK